MLHTYNTLFNEPILNILIFLCPNIVRSYDENFEHLHIFQIVTALRCGQNLIHEKCVEARNFRCVVVRQFNTEKIPRWSKLKFHDQKLCTISLIFLQLSLYFCNFAHILIFLPYFSPQSVMQMAKMCSRSAEKGRHLSLMRTEAFSMTQIAKI